LVWSINSGDSYPIHDHHRIAKLDNQQLALESDGCTKIARGSNGKQMVAMAVAQEVKTIALLDYEGSHTIRST